MLTLDSRRVPHAETQISRIVRTVLHSSVATFITANLVCTSAIMIVTYKINISRVFCVGRESSKLCVFHYLSEAIKYTASGI